MAKSYGRRSAYVGIAAALYSVTSFAADAQPTTSDEDKGLEEVIVTAQKREERLIDVPGVINAVQAEELVSQNLVGIRDYYSRVPGLAFDGNKTYNLSLRGITTGDATNPTLAILVDDIQFGATTQAGLGNSLFPDFDPSMLERIEVLHGPQGTLYGAASLGGLIKYVTRQPDTQRFTARVEAGIQSVKGGDSGWTGRAAINLPLATDQLALRVSAFDREDPAYIDNVFAGGEGKDVNNVHVRGGQAALLWKPTDSWSMTLSAMQQKRNADFSPSTRVQVNAEGVPTFTPYFGRDNVSLAATSDIGDQRLYSARIEGDFGNDLHFTSLTAYGKSAGTNFQDVSSVFFFIPLFYGFPPGSGAGISIDDVQHTNKFSQEFRLNGKVDRLDWRGGLFYTREKSSVDQALQLFDPSGAHLATPYDGTGPNSYRERAIFADAVYHMTDQWDVQAGARYAKNKQASGADTVIDGPAQAIFGPGGPADTLRSNDNSFTWAVSPVYHFNPDLMAYLRVASGYRPGGPNTVLPSVPGAYKPDKVVNYEVGFKGIAADRAFSWDAALFQIEWKDVQLQDTDNATQFTYTTNGGKARSRGAELALGIKPYKGLHIDAAAALMDATLTQNIALVSGADTLVGGSGDRLPASAKFSSNVSVQQDIPLSGELTAFVGANWIYVGNRESAFASTAATGSRFHIPSYSQFDLRTGVNYGDDWHLNVYVRNVTDKRGIVSADNRNGTSITFANFLVPRTVGVSLAKEF